VEPHRQGLAARCGRWMDGLLGGVAALVLFLLMALTFVDVWGRYVFNAPVPGGFEMTELMMAVLIFAGLPIVTRQEEHVAIDILDPVMPPVLLRLQAVLVNLLCGICSAVVAWRLWLRGMQMAEYGDTTATLKIALAPFVHMMSVLMGASAAIFLVKALRARPPRSSLV